MNINEAIFGANKKKITELEQENKLLKKKIDKLEELDEKRKKFRLDLDDKFKKIRDDVNDIYLDLKTDKISNKTMNKAKKANEELNKIVRNFRSY